MSIVLEIFKKYKKNYLSQNNNPKIVFICLNFRLRIFKFYCKMCFLHPLTLNNNYYISDTFYFQILIWFESISLFQDYRSFKIIVFNRLVMFVRTNDSIFRGKMRKHKRQKSSNSIHSFKTHWINVDWFAHLLWILILLIFKIIVHRNNNYLQFNFLNVKL